MDVALQVFYMNNKAFHFFRVRVVVFNATFNNISVISWDSVFLVKDLLFRYLVTLSIKRKKTNPAFTTRFWINAMYRTKYQTLQQNNWKTNSKLRIIFVLLLDVVKDWNTIQFNAHDRFLKYSSPGTLNVKRFESQIIYLKVTVNKHKRKARKQDSKFFF